MGDILAPAISTDAIYKTAYMFESDSPKVANLLKTSSYVDDLIDSLPSKSEAIEGSRGTQNMLAKGGFTVKCWQFSQESGSRTGSELSYLKPYHWCWQEEIVLGQVMIIFDPLGFVCPYTLLGRINRKETWSQKLGNNRTVARLLS